MNSVSRFGVAVAVVSLVLAAAPVERIVTLDPASQARAGIITRPVLVRAFGDALPVVGEIVRAPGATVTVRTIVDGRVVAIEAKPGERVRAGDPLLRIHSHQVQKMEGDFIEARDSLRLAEARVAAGEELLAVEGISRIAVEQRRQEVLAARLHYDRAHHELVDVGYTEGEAEGVLHREPDGYLTLRAPAAGAVLSLGVEEHAWFRAFDPLVVLGDPAAVEVQLQINPNDAPRVAAGDVVEFSAVGRPEAMGRARVLTPIPNVDPQTRTMTVRATIERAPATIVPGLYVQGQLMHGEERQSPSVPEKAVIRIGDGDYVFVRRGPESFEARAVQLGAFNGSRYEIASGVREGEEVAVEGVFLLKSALLAGTGEEP